jgi:hypothetical protein
VTPPRTISTRTQLLELLAEAAELEHGIACSYLYAAFSLRRDLAEGGMGWAEQQAVRRWAAQIYFVASQEMLHLALVWNLTTAIGGAPNPLRPNFPQGSKYYSLDRPIELQPFSEACLRRFIAYEHPATPTPAHVQTLADAGGAPNDLAFSSVGELYGLIRSGFETIPEGELFIGAPGQQMTPALAHFPDLVAVSSRASALAAIAEIVHQGEGVATDRNDSHFGVFVSILAEFQKLRGQGADFAPTRPAMRNPVTLVERGYGDGARQISDPLAQRTAQFFDDVYELMLSVLAWSFTFDTTEDEVPVRTLCNLAIELMPRVVLPLGEGLMMMPAGADRTGETAGPSFGLVRPLMLPHRSDNALRICRERLTELATEAAGLRAEATPDPVKRACGHVQEMARAFAR